MTDMTTAIQKPGIAGVTPTYTQCTASDKFSVLRGGRYMLHYKNGATPTTQLYINEQVASVPAGAVTPAIPTGGTKWSDVQVSAALGATTERVCWLDPSANYTDAQGFINLVHNTPTTLTLAIFGPF
jgi:hypothetical protein